MRLKIVDIRVESRRDGRRVATTLALYVSASSVALPSPPSPLVALPTSSTLLYSLAIPQAECLGQRIGNALPNAAARLTADALQAESEREERERRVRESERSEGGVLSGEFDGLSHSRCHRAGDGDSDGNKLSLFKWPPSPLPPPLPPLLLLPPLEANVYAAR